MKKLTVLFAVLALQTEGYVIQTPTTNVNTRPAPVGWVHIQKLLLPLFENVCELSTDSIIVRLNEEFKLDPSSGNYLKPDVIENLQNLRAGKGFLPKGEIFTELNVDHINELKIIYEILFYAKDFDTFYKAACWARQNINCGLFVDAIYLAILNRRDTEKVSVPAPYEVLPNYFVRKDFIIKASSLIRGEMMNLDDGVRNVGNAYIVDVNYTTNFYDESDDKLAYFHEDVGLNSFYYLTRLKNLVLMNSSRYQPSKYGQILYHTMKQLMARYNLERYSNGLPELDDLDWDYLDSLYSYDPMLVYSNGNDFSRTSTNGDNEILKMLKNIENNIPSVVIHMRDGGYNKSEIIGHLMEILLVGENSYEKLALQFLRGDKTITSDPSVLEHFMTTVRDPMFWKLNKKIVDIVDSALQVLPSYTRDQIYFPGVEIQNIEVKKMMTSFENFVFDVTSALRSETEETKFQVKISQPRLTNKPFAFKISVSSFVAQKAVVKLYLGPKVIPGQLVEKKNMFMLVDCFEYNLKVGTNVITRASNEMMKLSDDFVSFDTIHKKIADAEFGVDTLPLKTTWSQLEFPSRLILPKGTQTGLPLHVFVFIAPYVKPVLGGSKNYVELNKEAIFSPGYPLDLDIEIQQLFNLPNALVKDIIITHKTESASYNKGSNTYNTNPGGKSWQGGEFESEVQNGLLGSADRPDFTKKTFNYKAKKSNYGKKSEYATKRDEKQYQKYKTQDTSKDDAAKEEVKEKEYDNIEVINNIYINPDLDHEITTDNKEDKNSFYKIPMDTTDDKNFYEISDKVQRNDYDKVIENMYPLKPRNVLKTPNEGFSNIFNIIFKPLENDSDEKVFE